MPPVAFEKCTRLPVPRLISHYWLAILDIIGSEVTLRLEIDEEVVRWDGTFRWESGF